MKIQTSEQKRYPGHRVLKDISVPWLPEVVIYNTAAQEPLEPGWNRIVQFLNFGYKNVNKIIIIKSTA